MDVKYQVFVSSTFADLEEERRSVIEAILNLGHIPVGMEAFQASDDDQWSYIKRRIDDCDYYVVIVAERYGSESKGKSYTQMEYEYALERGVPVAGFLLHNDTRKSWPSDKVEFDKKAKVDKFRRICEKKLVKFWKNKDDLAAKVSLALHELMQQKPRIGWVRANSVPSANVLEELTRLSDEKRALQTRLESLQSDDKIRIPAEARYYLDHFDDVKIESFFPRIEDEHRINHLNDVLIEMHKVLSIPISISDIVYHFEIVYNMSQDTYYGVELLIAELAAANILTFTHVPGKAGSGSTTHYHLTEFGKKFIIFAKIRRKENYSQMFDEEAQA